MSAIIKIKLQFCGLQELFLNSSSEKTMMPLWTVVDCNFNTRHQAHFLRGSTFSEQTLLQAGFFVPDATGWQRGQIFDPLIEPKLAFVVGQ